MPPKSWWNCGAVVAGFKPSFLQSVRSVQEAGFFPVMLTHFMLVLVIDADTRSASATIMLCARLGHDARAVRSVPEALVCLEEIDVALVLAAPQFLIEHGLCEQIRALELARKPRVVAMQAELLPAHTSAALQAGADDVVLVTADQQALHSCLLVAARNLSVERRLTLENRRLSDACDQLTDDYWRVSSDLALASRVQRSLLPEPASFGDYEARGLLTPAMYTAGDVYDFFALDNGLLAFYSVDVVGHGSAAAMVSFAVRHQLGPGKHSICRRNLECIPDRDEAIMQTVLDLNQCFYVEDSAQHWFTMVFGVIDTTTGCVTLCQAGHPPALHCSGSDGAIDEIGRGGFPVAMFDDSTFELHHRVLAPGDRLVIYSDGVLGGLAPDNDAQGKERLKAALQEDAGADLESLLERLGNRLAVEEGDRELRDDVSVVVLERAA